MFKRNTAGTTSARSFQKSNIWNCVIRFLQIVAALVVIGYYAKDLNAAKKRNSYSDSKWVYAVAVGSISAISALLLAVLGLLTQFRTVAMVFPFEWVMVILWAAVTGIFAGMYFNENPEMDSGVQQMKIAAGFDLANFLLWVITAIVSTATFFYAPRRSLHTGRANLRA